MSCLLLASFLHPAKKTTNTDNSKSGLPNSSLKIENHIIPARVSKRPTESNLKRKIVKK
jgi:hypothetical protein